ncbi:hypothetical protein ACWIFN_16030, partial [Streptomyces adustus]
MPATSLAAYGISAGDPGAASAMINISQQVGGSIGTALLNTSATAAHLATHGSGAHAEAPVHGYRIGHIWAAGFPATAAVVTLLLISRQTAIVITQGANCMVAWCGGPLGRHRAAGAAGAEERGGRDIVAAAFRRPDPGRLSP